MEKFKSEFGQEFALVGQQKFTVPLIWEAALYYMQRELEILQWNKNQEKYPSPFENTGEDFKCDAFEVRAYSWREEIQPFNFKWRDVEISWYKNLGRGMSSNKALTAEMASEMLEECLFQMSLLEKEYQNERNSK